MPLNKETRNWELEVSAFSHSISTDDNINGLDQHWNSTYQFIFDDDNHNNYASKCHLCTEPSPCVNAVQQTCGLALLPKVDLVENKSQNHTFLLSIRWWCYWNQPYHFCVCWKKKKKNHTATKGHLFPKSEN